MISPPPWLLAAGLLFWGWFSGFMAVAFGMALLLEAPRYLQLRWELSARDFERIADLCTIAFISALAFQFVQSRHFPDSLISVLVWLPMLFSALLLGQRYSTAQRIPLSALFWSLRQRARGPKGDRRAGQAIDLDYAYFCLCLLATCSANPRTPWFFAGLSALGVYALWPIAPTRAPRMIWALTLVAALAIGYAVQAGLLQAQSSLEEWAFDWFAHRWRPPTDPYQSRTAIGDIGTLKSSDRIVLRLRAIRGSVPQRLRAATYTAYAGTTWSAPGQLFTPVAAENQSWVIAPGSGASVRISNWLAHNQALLPLPLGTFRLDALDTSGVQRNALGAVRIEQAPDMLLFDADFNPGRILDGAPDPVDLSLPATLRPVLEKVADEIGLPNGDAGAAAHALAGFFDAHFSYTLALARHNGTSRSLSQFLLEDRRGHCEYFATATVLLLRQAGIPARYATGYAVHEWSSLEQQYVVRKRHAHAWALAWIDGRWQELDTTPAIWKAEEEEAASGLEPVYDLLSLLNYRLALWQLAPAHDSRRGSVMLWTAAALGLYLAWRIWRRRSVRVIARLRVPADATTNDVRIGALLQALARLGYTRPAYAPLLRWTRELPLADSGTRQLLEDAVLGYYRARFDPLGSTPEQTETFQRRIGLLLQRLPAAVERKVAAAR